MKKYKFAIQVGDNITDIMMLPCVKGCEKIVRNLYEEGGRIIGTSVKFLYTLENGQEAWNGSWIVQDACDGWHVFSDVEYERVKDDTI